MSKTRISVCVPVHDIPERPAFVKRFTESLANQTFADWELVITDEGKMAENSNAAIKKATGEIVKVLYMDDYLYSEHALQNIHDVFEAGAKWAVSGCVHDDGVIHNPHYPKWGEEVMNGVNTIGSPSVLAFLNDEPLLFDERMSWMLDLDLYRRLYERYGPPCIINSIDIGIGVGKHQTTNTLTQEEKETEVKLFHGTTN